MKLDVYLFDKKCGELYSTSNNGVLFEYSKEYCEEQNNIPLSISLPIEKKSFTQKECIPYFFGLLPEGEIKQQIANELHISETSTLKLLEALGGECAGTVSLFNSEEKYIIPKSEYEFNDENYQLISNKEIADKILNCTKTPILFSDKEYRLSLAGAQQKIALANFNGSWYIPKNGAPSTHIIKPSRKDYTDIGINEYFSMSIAKEFLRDVPKCNILNFKNDTDSFDVFCIERYDRQIINKNESIKIKRIHQEDFCQALGIMSTNKYQNDGGPGIAQIINLIKNKSSQPVVDVQKTIEYFIFNFLIGNCDAHGKNYSLLWNNGIKLAPAYDIVSTVVYENLSRNLSMKIGGHYEIDKISKSHFIDTFEKCGINSRIINKTFEKFYSKIQNINNVFSNTPIAQKYNLLLEKIIIQINKFIQEP